MEHLRELKRIKVYDFHKITPQTYDLKIIGDPSGKNKTTGERLDDGEEKKKKKDKAEVTKGKAPKKGKGGKKDDSESDEPLNDKFDPSRKRKGKLGLKTDGNNKVNSVQTAVEHIALEMGHSMPVMTRGPEIELSTVKDVEDLKHVLAQHQINVPNDILRRAIILPKDVDSSAQKYPKDGESLDRNYFQTEAYLQKLARKEKELEKLEKMKEKRKM